MELANTTDVLANLAGGDERSIVAFNLLEAGIFADLAELARIPGASFFVLGAGTHGGEPANLTGGVHTPSNISAPDAWRLLELWYEQVVVPGRLALLVGVYAVDSEFDVKETAQLFVNGGFGTGLDLSETGLNGPSIFPVMGLGARLTAHLSADWTFRAAVLDGVPGDPDDPGSSRIHLSGDDGVFVIGELDYAPRRFDFLRFVLGGWHYTTDFERLAGTGPGGAPRTEGGTQGAYGFVEGRLFPEPGAPGQGLSGFLRFGWADDAVNRFEFYCGGGLVYSGAIPGRDEDALGFGFSTAVNGGDFRKAQQRAGRRVTRQESVLELTYRAQVLPWLGVQPTLQYTLEPGSRPALDDSFLLGLRFGVTF